jgi:hypothetical protein
MASPKRLTLEQLARLQSAIDARTIWGSVEGGKFAKGAIDAERSNLAPAVVCVWLCEDDRYVPLCVQEELQWRVQMAMERFPAIVESKARAQALNTSHTILAGREWPPRSRRGRSHFGESPGRRSRHLEIV